MDTTSSTSTTGDQLWERDVGLENLLPERVGPYLVQNDFRTTPSTSVVWTVEDGTELRRFQGRAISFDYWLDQRGSEIVEIDPTTLEDISTLALLADVDGDTEITVTAQRVFTNRVGEIGVYERDGTFRATVDTGYDIIDARTGRTICSLPTPPVNSPRPAMKVDNHPYRYPANGYRSNATDTSALGLPSDIARRTRGLRVLRISAWVEVEEARVRVSRNGVPAAGAAAG